MTQDQTVALVYPHQLWRNHPAVLNVEKVILVEDPLFFKQYRFHAKKLILHRASMTEFLDYCQKQGKQISRLEARKMSRTSDIGVLLREMGVKRIRVVEPTDTWLRQGIIRGCEKHEIEVQWYDDSSFLTPHKTINEWAKDRNDFYFTSFYIQQRKRLNILIDKASNPTGGKWSYDNDNRKKLPKGQTVPILDFPAERQSVKEARQYIEENFPTALGDSGRFIYPVTFEDSEKWLSLFVQQRLALFGDYEDAITEQEPFLFHSVLTPMLNIGLLTPNQICQTVMDASPSVPLNSLEGFIRQVIGWREFVRLVYIAVGSKQRTTNSWNFSHAVPRSFYDGTTEIAPVDSTIKRVLQHSYCHHIERLMVLGNFMLLCEIGPDHVYRWFMEMFIDAYDWVMVPNVYGMSQHADGGLMTTKPYISGSSYVMRMSNYKKGPWCEIWDALYWRFIERNRKFFSENPRMKIMVAQLDKMGATLHRHLRVAEDFLERVHR